MATFFEIKLILGAIESSYILIICVLLLITRLYFKQGHLGGTIQQKEDP